MNETIVNLSLDDHNNLLISKLNVYGTSDISKYGGGEPPYAVATNLTFLSSKVKAIKDRTLFLLLNENHLHCLTQDDQFLEVTIFKI